MPSNVRSTMICYTERVPPLYTEVTYEMPDFFDSSGLPLKESPNNRVSRAVGTKLTHKSLKTSMI